ncbi:MAG: N-acetylmuramic acid 6-phosphate etherase [Bryobacterales bacterium]|nr:N-acetylmuramic acid 6-phosphate etherase [Bryobacteraceae bacterium]MDW8130019.1 N-acetylmuramic acid 6-phosphate etherase [Bryobacterales bacterium]
MFEDLLTEQPNPVSQGLDALPTEQILRLMNAEDHKVAPAVAREIPNIARAVEVIVAAIERGGRLFYLGAGTSGRLGVLDAVECPPTFNVPPELVQGVIAGGEAALARATEASEDDPEAGARDLAARGFRPCDVLVGIAASGRTPYVLGAVVYARRLGATTIGISCTPGSELARAVDIAITPLPGPEIIAGSTRLKAGTATKLVLNMLSTATMIRLGHVYGNLMVNVQPKNVKLLDRARRIIRAATGVSYEEAARLLEAAGGQVKIAIVMAKLGVDRNRAEACLAAAGGRVSEALHGAVPD